MLTLLAKNSRQVGRAAFFLPSLAHLDLEPTNQRSHTGKKTSSTNLIVVFVLDVFNKLLILPYSSKMV